MANCSAASATTIEDPTALSSPARTDDWGFRARVIAAILRRAVRIFFRDIEIVGLERVPTGGPLVLVANHVNGIVDPLLVGLLGLRARFLAKSTLWSNPIIRPLLDLTGGIPVYRHQDAGEDTSKNADSFARCHDALAAGQVIALFPEGKSHNAASLAPLKTGAARIVLEAEAKHGDLGIRIVPIGLTFDAKGLFRSRALLRVGHPIDPAPERRLYRGDAWVAVRALTARIARGLEAVTLNYASWEEARLIDRAADLYADADGAAARALGDRFTVRQTFADGYRDLATSDPERARAAADAVARYDTLLHAARVRDEHVITRVPLVSACRFLGRSALFLLGWLPLALLGTALNWIPYRLVGALAQRRAAEADFVATYKLIGGVVLFPLWWLLCAVAVGALAGPLAGFATAPAAAGAALVALHFHERRAAIWEDIRAYAVLRSRRALARELAQRRNALLATLHELVQRSASSLRTGIV